MTSFGKNKNIECLKKRLKESFTLLDGDGDGYLNYNEMKAATKAFGFTFKKSYILSVIRMYDKFGCNKICFEDFYYFVSEKLSKRNPTDEIKHVFKLFVKNSGNNKITLRILQTLNDSLGCDLTKEEMKLMIKEFDLDQDDSINEDEFMDLMINNIM